MAGASISQVHAELPQALSPQSPGSIPVEKPAETCAASDHILRTLVRCYCAHQLPSCLCALGLRNDSGVLLRF